LYLAWRIWRRRRVRVVTRIHPSALQARMAGDPRIASLLHALTRLGYPRPPGTPLLRWTRELPLGDAETRLLLEDTVRSYYKTRFDPLGSTRVEQEMFERGIGKLLQRLAAGSASAR
jgi:hypothetical protein